MEKESFMEKSDKVIPGNVQADVTGFCFLLKIKKSLTREKQMQKIRIKP